MKSLAHNSFVSAIEAGPLKKNVLYDMDLKCFDYPWEPEEWQECFKDKVVLIAEIPGAKAVGFAVCTLLSDGIFIDKIGVKPNYRKQGVSRKLIEAIQLQANKQKWPHVVATSIPETLLSPGQENDISGWIQKIGFKAKVPLEPGIFQINDEYITGVPCLLE